LATLEKVRFLVVDDNVHMVHLVKTILKGFGAKYVFEAKSGAEAFERIKHDNIDIILLDYLMGDEDGVEFVRRVRDDTSSPHPFVSVIMLTAHAERTRVEMARDAGVNEFCTKPVTASELFRKVVAVIEHPRSYVRTETYRGPDRRRRDDPAYKGEERRSDRKNPS
jgi:two-component system chemotaxis response regulator CheY